MDTVNIKAIQLDLKNPKLTTIGDFTQNDTNIIKFTLVENGNVINLSILDQIVINYQKPNNEVISRIVTAENNVITYKLGFSEMEKPGLGKLVLQLFKSDNRISTFIVNVNVKKSIEANFSFGETQKGLVDQVIQELNLVKNRIDDLVFEGVDTSGLATKEELIGLATKEELTRLATKTELEGLVTKEEENTTQILDLISQVRILQSEIEGLKNGNPIPPDTAPPNNVTNLVVTNNTTGTSLTLTWTASTSNDVAGYEVYRGTTLLTTITGTSYNVTGLTANTSYTFTVKAKDTSNNVASGTSVTATTVYVDNVAPILTITPGTTFSDTQTVTMTTNEAATIYYTLDGTTPTQTSQVYTTPLTLSETTIVKAFAKDTAGNVSVVQMVEYILLSPEVPEVPETPGVITDGLVAYFDFTNKVGTNSNSVVDSISGLTATLNGVSHDGTDGYLDNSGVLLRNEDSIKIPTNELPLKDINMNNGLTFVKVSKNTNGVLWRVDGVNDYRSVIGSNGFTANVPYNKTDATKGFHGVSYQGKLNGTNAIYNTWLKPKDSGASDVVALSIKPDGSLGMCVNKAIPHNATGVIAAPSDFASWNNQYFAEPLNLRKTLVGLNTAPETVCGFLIYNRALTDEELAQLCDVFEGNDSFMGISVDPKSVNLPVGSSRVITVGTNPPKYLEEATVSFQSGNDGFVTVSETGLIRGISDGETHIMVSVEVNGQSFSELVSVTVGGNNEEAPVISTRIVDGVAINRKIDTLEVGQSFPVMATEISNELPYDIFDDNLVSWETSNINVATVDYGVIEAKSSGTCNITVHDSTGQYSESFELTVIPKAVVNTTEAETYNVLIADYGIFSDGTNAITTTNGIQSALDYASTNNYKKIIFPYGRYLVNPTVRTINFPSQMIIDFSNAIINIEPSILTGTGYYMFRMNNVINTKVMNMHVYGERDSTTLANSTENCISLVIEDGLNSGIENCTFSKSPGFNVMAWHKGNREMGVATSSISVGYSTFELGNINDDGTADDTKAANYYRTNRFIDITGLGSTYLFGYTNGYAGYPHLRSRLYSMFFYNANYELIGLHKYHLQFYDYEKPANAKYVKIVVYQATAPTSGDGDFGGAVAFLRTYGMPRNCYIRNSTFEDNFSTGIAMCGGQGWLLEGNTFSRNTGRLPNCDIDWEDAWEYSVGDVARNNTFNSTTGVVLCGGGSLALHSNTFNRSSLLIYGRVQNWRVFNNNFNERGSMTTVTISTQGDSVFAGNMLRRVNSPNYTLGKQHANARYQIHNLDNTVIN